MNERPSGLPKSWQWVHLKDISTHARKVINPSGTPEQRYNYLELQRVLPGQWEDPGENWVLGRAIRSSCLEFRPKQVLYSKLRPYLNKVVVTATSGIASAEFVPIAAKDTTLDPSYLVWYLRCPQFVTYATSHTTGSRQPRVAKNALWSAPVPLPPAPEQRRIVAKIEALFDRIREAKRLRSRAEDDSTVLFDAALEEVLADIYANSPQIAALGEFGTAFNGRASGSGQSEVRVFKTKHVYSFDLKQRDPSFMKPDQISKCPPDRYLRQGDVLVCNIARGTLGRVCYVDHAENNWTVDTQIMILRTNSRCLGKWLFYYLYSRRGQKELFAREKGIAFADKRGQTHLYPRDVLTIPVPLPSIAKQTDVVSYLDRVYQRANALNERLTDTDAEFKRLEHSILDRAFRGEL